MANPQGVHNISEETWAGVMTVVAEEHVEGAYKKFYEDTTIGKHLDENADDIFKSDGIVTQVASEVGYITGTATLAAFTGLPPSTLAGTAAFGRYTEEYWASARDSSWKSIQSKYANGEISEEDYTSMSKIRSLSDEDWEYIKLQYEQGAISEENYATFESIREMPEEWTTSENRIKGMAYGGANAAWEALQWQVGGSLDDLVIKGWSRTANSVLRVGIDTTFNALDTPFRSLVDSVTSDRTFIESWEQQGGWTSVVTDVTVGLIGSVSGEVINAKKIEDNMIKLKIDSLDELPVSFWTDIPDPNNVVIEIDGHTYTYKDFCDLTKQDVTALLNSCAKNESWENEIWSKDKLRDTLHTIFDKYFEAEKIDEIIDDINIIPKDEWRNFVRGRDDININMKEGLNGFVDYYHNVYLPSDASQHTATHELFHRISELFDRKTTDGFGFIKKVSGIREFFTDGTNSDWANEVLTEYLTSKYTDGLLYDSLYDIDNVLLWSRIDEAISQSKFSEYGDVLLNGYVCNNTSQIREFFDQYAFPGAYDQFVKCLQTWWESSKDLDNIVSAIEMSVYEEKTILTAIENSVHEENTTTILWIIKSIFGLE